MVEDGGGWWRMEEDVSQARRTLVAFFPVSMLPGVLSEETIPVNFAIHN